MSRAKDAAQAAKRAAQRAAEAALMATARAEGYRARADRTIEGAEEAEARARDGLHAS